MNTIEVILSLLFRRTCLSSRKKPFCKDGKNQFAFKSGNNQFESRIPHLFFSAQQNRRICSCVTSRPILWKRALKSGNPEAGSVERDMRHENFHCQSVTELRLCWISLTSCEQMIFRFPPHGKALRPFLQGLDQNCLGHLKKFSHSYICLKVLLKVRNGQLVPSY